MNLNTTVYNRTTDAGRVLIVGPSLGGNSVHQWTKVAAELLNDARVVFVDLPGTGLGAVWDDADEPTLDAVCPAAVRPLLAAALSRGGGRPLLVVTSTYREAENTRDALASLLAVDPALGQHDADQGLGAGQENAAGLAGEVIGELVIEVQCGLGGGGAVHDECSCSRHHDRFA